MNNWYHFVGTNHLHQFTPFLIESAMLLVKYLIQLSLACFLHWLLWFAVTSLIHTNPNRCSWYLSWTLRIYILTSFCNVSLRCTKHYSMHPLLCKICDMMQKSSATVCTCKCMVPLILLYLVLRKWFLQVQYHCPLMYDVNQVIYVRVFSTGGKDLVTKHDANGHQQSMDQCTAAQTRVTLTGLCQSVNTALANYNLTPCNLRLSKLLRKSITYCMYQATYSLLIL